MNRRKRAALAVIVVSMAGACASGPALSPLPPAPSGATTLGPGDRVRVSVFGDDRMTTETEIDSTGEIAVPLVGRVRAEGMTAAEVETALTGRLRREVINDPRVTVQAVKLRQVYVMGEVQKPGGYDFGGPLTVLDAVALAGGFTYRANTDRITVRRTRGGDRAPHAASASTPLLPGDVIEIGERWF